jgi:PKD domain/Bacterial Ig domain/Gametolysin peptidase M11
MWVDHGARLAAPRGMRRLVLVMLCGVVGCAQPEAETSVVSSHRPLIAQPEPVALDAARQAHDAFRVWARGYSSSAPSKRLAIEGEGLRLAQARRPYFVALLLQDPEQALELAVNPVERTIFPDSVKAELEEWRDGVGALQVIGGLSLDGKALPLERIVRFEGRDEVLRAGVFGARLTQQTRGKLRLHGVALDGVIALTNDRLRRLFPGEPARDLPLELPRTCPTSRKVADPGLVYDGADANFGFCTMEHATAFEQGLAAQELNAVETLNSVWSQGSKTVLFIRVDFSDRVGDPVAQSSVESVMNTQVKPFYEAASYGKTTLVTTVIPTVRVPKTVAQYQTNQDYYTLMTDARAAAKAAGYDTANYDLDVIAFPAIFSGGWAGRAYVGSKGVWLNGYFDLRVIGHELGHNYGVNHANYWSAAGLSIIGPGTNVEYGNPFDMMGAAGGANSHFNAWFKRLYDWVTSEETGVVTASGTYRVNALEQSIASGLHALKIVRDPVHDYWVEFRPGFNNVNVQNGASINWGYHSNTGSHLLDMTPGDGDLGNSALLIGRTFPDPLANLFITPIAKVATPAALDVVVNVGPFPGNRAPSVSISASTSTPTSGQLVTFTATASDPDGDALAYAWTFDDGSFGPNAAVATKSFTASRAYTVLLTVSDMKGQTATTSTVVVVGSPTTFTLSGQVALAGVGVPGVRISDGTRATFTTSDGHYTLTNVPAGNETINADKVDFTFTRGFAAPLAVAASQSGLDFTAAAVAGYQVQGKVTASGVNLANVVVTDGVRTATTNATGDYSLGPAPTGRYTLSASLAGWSLTPSFTNPIDVIGGNVTGQNFYATGAFLSGSIPAAGVTIAPVVTDGVRSATATLGGTNWFWNLNSVPNGSWNLTASSPGVTLVPVFINPVMVNANMGQSNLNFRLGTTTGVNVSGTVKTGGTPLPGVTVSDGTRTSTTDSLGRYVITTVPAGTFTLTPTLTGYTFVPATRAITVATTDLTGQDFSTTVVNLPPTVVTAAGATPNPVVTGTTTQLQALGADDGGEAALTYRWTASGGGFPVNFSANGTNAAKNATATFTGTGFYTIECVISDAGGLSVRTQTTVTVQAVPTSMVILPATATLLTGASQALTAQLQDQFGRPTFTGTPTWTTTAGTLNMASGWSSTFTAPLTPVVATVQASVASKSASARITVTSAAAPMISSAARATPNPVTAKSTSVAVRATDDGGEAALSYTWSMGEGPGVATFVPNGTNAAKDAIASFTKSGSYVLTVTVSDADANTATSTVTVVVAATPTALDVQPAVVSLQAGQTQGFTATATDQFAEPLAPQPALTWVTSGGGTISAAGLFTADLTPGGPFTITVTTSSLTGTAQITVGAAPDTAAPTATIIAPVSNARLTALSSLEAMASDNVGVVKVEFWLDGTTKLGEAASAPWAVMSDFSAVAEGAHTLTAKAFDAAGNSGTSDGVAITVGHGPVDAQPPSIRITSPSAGAMTALMISVSVEASDDVGVTTVDFELDGTSAAHATAAPFSTMLTVSEGAHSLVALARDASGKFTRSEALSFTSSANVAITQPTAVVGACGCSTGSCAAHARTYSGKERHH